MDWFKAIAFLLFIIFNSAMGSLEIVEVRGPSAVQNGTTSRLVLDCIFSAKEEDLTGLVVKWFFNHSPYPVYQWIPGVKPQAFGILKGRLDLSHSVSTEEMTKHRALTILNPTTDLSGEYSCSVSSFVAEDSMTKQLVVYVPANEAELTYKKPSLSSIVVTCNAHGIFPEPEVFVYRSRPFLDRSHRNVITGSEISKKVSREGQVFNVTANVVLFDFELRGDTMFTCEISIPGTNYNVHKELFYTPGRPQHQASVYSNCSPCSIWDFYLIVSLFIVFLYGSKCNNL